MKYYLSIIGLMLLSSCINQKKETQAPVQVEQAIDEVRSLPSYTYTDSLMQGSHKVLYTITSQPDEWKVLTDGPVKLGSIFQGQSYDALFSRSFSKADFRSQLSKDFQKYGIMDGLRFNHAEEGKLYFNTCVSYPDSDMSCPFFLVIGPDGSYVITPDNTIDEDLPPAPEEIAE